MPDQHALNDLPAFALGALEPDERQAVERHLAICSSCRLASMDYHSLAKDLRNWEPLEQPPLSTWEAIAGKLPPRTSSVGHPAARAILYRSRFRVMVLGWAATAAALAVLGGVTVWHTTHPNPGASVADLAGAGDTSVIPLAGASTSATGRFFVSAHDGLGGVALAGMPSSPAGTTYQVWYVSKEQEWTPGGSVRVNANGNGVARLQLPESIDDFAGVAICSEPPIGSAALWGELVLSGPLYE